MVHANDLHVFLPFLLSSNHFSSLGNFTVFTIVQCIVLCLLISSNHLPSPGHFTIYTIEHSTSAMGLPISSNHLPSLRHFPVYNIEHTIYTSQYSVLQWGYQLVVIICLVQGILQYIIYSIHALYYIIIVQGILQYNLQNIQHIHHSKVFYGGVTNLQ